MPIFSDSDPTDRERNTSEAAMEGGGRDVLLSRAMTKWAIGTADSHSNRRGVILTDMIWSVRLHRWNIVCDLPSPLAISQFLREALGIVVAANLDKWKRDFGDSCADCDASSILAKGRSGRFIHRARQIGTVVIGYCDFHIKFCLFLLSLDRVSYCRYMAVGWNGC